MRSIWSGSLTFGLVNIPVRLYSATDDKTLDFDLLHEPDMARIRYAKVCKADEKEVSNDEIVRGFQYRKGEYVVMDDEDFDKANVRRSKSIEIMDFVMEGEVDTTYYEKPYYLEPDRGADRAYALLREALRQSGKIAVARFVLRTREHLAAVKPLDNVLVLNQLRFKSQIREYEGLNLPSVEEAAGREMEMAMALIEQLTQPFKPDEYRDTYTEELMRVIEEKAEGRVPVAVGEEPEPTKVVDLMAMLKASLDQEREKAKAA